MNDNSEFQTIKLEGYVGDINFDDPKYSYEVEEGGSFAILDAPDANDLTEMAENAQANEEGVYADDTIYVNEVTDGTLSGDGTTLTAVK